MKRSSAILKSFVVLGMLTFGLVAGVSAQDSIIIRRPGHPGPPIPHPTPIINCTPSPAGLVGWWKGEGNANDSISTNDGTLSPTGASYASGLVGLAFRFDGTNGCVQIPDADALKPANVTIEAWIWLDPNLPANRGSESIVFKKNTWSAWFEGYSLLKQTIDNGNGTYSDRFQFCVSRYGNQVAINSPTIAQRGVWYHVAATYDGNQSILYVNGVAEASATPGFALDYDTTPVYIGTSGTWPPYLSMFGGIIDEVSIYNRALSSNEIAAIYNAGSAGKCLPTPPAVPVISSFTPTSGTNGTVVTISGTNFSATAALNTVYFGAVRAGVLSANPTTLLVTVPAGATYAPITETVNGLIAYASQPFMPTFLGDGSGISTSSFGPRQDLSAGNNPWLVIIADIDGDGKPDLVVANVFGNNISVYRNISTNGSLTADSFAPRVDFATTTGTYSPYGLVVADVDGDGKLDMITTDYNDNTVSIFRNTSTPGDINSNSFASRVDLATGAQPQGVAVRDLDGDGRPDLLVANSGDGTVSVYRNIGMMGDLTTNSFAPKVDITVGGGCQDVAVGDLDGDGKPDVVTANGGDNTLSLLRNTSTPGSITTNSFAAKVDIAVLTGPVRVAIGDLDGDGKPDLIVTCYFPETVSVLRNISTVGSLTTNSFAPEIDYSLGGRGHTPAIADLDGDGKPDLAVVTELDSMLSIFRNVSTPGSFTNSSFADRVDFSAGYNAWGVAIGDLDGDGRPDIVFANQYDDTVSIYQNEVSFGGPPVITTQPTNQTAVQGASVVLSVTATGAAPLSYQWCFNGTNIFGATNDTLTLTNLHPNQSGNYAVIITTPHGSITSSNASVTVIVQNILVYKYSGSEKIITAGQSLGYAYSGQMFFIPDNTNGTFVGWSTIKGKKQYWVNPLPEYLWITIPGAGNQTFTVVGQAGQAIDTNGHPNIWADLYKGQNTLLTIGQKKYFSFPNTFANDATHVYPDSQTGKMVLDESASTFTFMAQGTQTANNTGQTMTDLVNALTRWLDSQGYQQQ